MTCPATNGTLMADDLDLATIAGRLGKSPRWLVGRLTEDRRRLVPRFQFHHYIGRSPRWDENEYQALRAALMKADSERHGVRQQRHGPNGDKPGSPSSSATDFGISPAGSALRDAASASAEVQAWPLGQKPRHRGGAPAAARAGNQRRHPLRGPSIRFARRRDRGVPEAAAQAADQRDGHRQLKEIDRRFGTRQVDKIAESEWTRFVDARMQGRAAATRERYITCVVSLLGPWGGRAVGSPNCRPSSATTRRATPKSAAPAASAIAARADRAAGLRSGTAPKGPDRDCLVGRITAVGLISGCRLCITGSTRARADRLSDTKHGGRVTSSVHRGPRR